VVSDISVAIFSCTNCNQTQFLNLCHIYGFVEWLHPLNFKKCFSDNL
jgi:hypothetical protein